VDPEASPAPTAPSPLAPGFELPTAREVIGRGLQLALDGNRDIRNVSLYVGLMILAIAGPAALLVVVDLPTLFTIPWQLPQTLTPSEVNELASIFAPLYAVGALALLGLVTISLDGELMAASILAGRAAGQPLTMRESLARSRQVFWRYGFAAFAVGILSTAVSSLVGLALGTFGKPDSVGGNLLGSLVATLAVAPFGYILTAIVIGDVDGAAALGRSISLAGARPRLAVVVAFAFLASTLQVFGLGVAFDVVGEVVTFLHPQLDLGGSGLLVVVPAVAIALVAFGSLALTVGAVTAAPQIAAFLGLTHYAAGLDRARSQAGDEAAPAASDTGPTASDTEPPGDGAAAPGEPVALSAMPSQSHWAQPARRAVRTRWVTIPMVALIVFEALAALSGIAAAAGR
jgi:hypothetical protein